MRELTFDELMKLLPAKYDNLSKNKLEISKNLQKTFLGYDLAKPVPNKLVFESVFWIFIFSLIVALWLKKIANDWKD